MHLWKSVKHCRGGSYGRFYEWGWHLQLDWWLELWLAIDPNETETLDRVGRSKCGDEAWRWLQIQLQRNLDCCALLAEERTQSHLFLTWLLIWLQTGRQLEKTARAWYEASKSSKDTRQRLNNGAASWPRRHGFNAIAGLRWFILHFVCKGLKRLHRNKWQVPWLSSQTRDQPDLQWVRGPSKG